MRLLDLELVAFGAIANRRLQLSKGEGDAALHLIYGSNEAGKSTTLRAILGLLFGIDHHSPDAKLFGGDALRIKARLLDSDNRVLCLARRKGMKNTLLGDGDEPLDEAVLQRLLGGMPAAVFRTMFGLDHERLRQGGEQLRLGQGDLGESLFQAGVGLTGLHQLLAQLGKEADDLFRPRGQRPLNQAIEEHGRARKSVREHVKHADAARAQEQELADAREQRLALQARRSELQTEHSRLARALRVLPKLSQRRDLEERRAALGEVPQLPEDCETQRHKAQQELLSCASQIDQLERSLQKLDAALAQLVLPASLLELSAEHVRAIRNRLGSHLKAAQDLPSRRAELRLLELEAEASLRALGDPVRFEQVESLRVETATQTRIAKLAREHSGLCERATAAERGLQAAEAQLGKARAELDALPRLPGHAEAALPDELVLPSEATVEAFRAQLERLDQARARHDAACQNLTEREERVQVQLDRMAREGAPPTEADLERARAVRDALLPLIRTALSGEISAHPRLLLEFESLLQRADETADRLRREASRVAELAQLQAEREAIARERARLAERRAELALEQERASAEWQRVWEPLGIVPRAPLEMRPLLARISSLLDSGERGRSEARRCKREAQSELDSWQQSWRELMGRLRLREGASAEEAQAVLEELRRLFEKVDAIAQLRTRVDAMQRDAEQFERDVTALVARHLPELAGGLLDQAAEQLARAHDQAQRDFEQRTRIEAERREAAEQLAVLKRRAEQAERALTELMRVSRTEDVEALEQVERRFRQARELERQLAGVAQDLIDQSDGEDIEALAVQAAALGADRIRARLEDVREELEQTDGLRQELDQQIVRLELGLQTLRRDDLAAQDAVEAEQHLARIKTLAHAYVRKRLAATLLSREIRRYRDENQAPIVGRASELFARLTLARYPRLQVGYDARDEPVLLCVDAQGRGVQVDALSDGARDQLYLALRLASLERFAEHNAPMPLVLDDVLIHFDDERARAALQVLGEFASVTQVLFFTHHERLLELAREAIPQARLVEHRLADEHAPPVSHLTGVIAQGTD